MKNRIFFPILLLTGLMPLHNLIVQYSTKILKLPEYIVFWKDWLVGFLIFILILDIFGIIGRLGFVKLIKENRLKVFLPLILVIFLNILTILSSFVFNPFNLRAFVSGYYFELWWLDFFAVLMTWFNLYLYEVNANEIPETKIEGFADSSKFDQLFQSNTERLTSASIFSDPTTFHSISTEVPTKPLNNSLKLLKKQFWMFRNIICIGFLITAAISGASLLFGQAEVLGSYGYANNTESTGLVGNSLVCHTIDYNVDGCRLSGTMSHPIHYAAYLLLVLPVLIIGFINAKNKFSKVAFLLMTILNMFLIFQTYSRYALLSLPLLLALALIYIFRNKLFGFKSFFAKFLVLVCLVLPIFVSLIFVNIRSENLPSFLPKSITKPSSTIWHYYHFFAGVKTLEALGSKSIIGVGMGQSGSAARSKYQDLQKNTLYTQYGKIAYDWNLTEESFLLVENWYMQAILNNGWIYGVIYILLTMIPIAGFWKFLVGKNSSKYILEMIFGLGFFAVIIGNQLEHLWENQTVVIFWVLIYFYAKIWKNVTQKIL